VVDGGTYFSSEERIAQGGVLSPLLMNVALHGMEGEILRFAQNEKWGQNDKMSKNDRRGQGDRYVGEQPVLVRYADDFVILHTDLNELQRAIKRVRQWLATMGLRLHAQKTHITHTLTPYQGRVGFDFLGFSICQEVEREDDGRGLGNNRRGMGDNGRGKPRPYRQEQLPGVKTIVTYSHQLK